MEASVAPPQLIRAPLGQVGTGVTEAEDLVTVVIPARNEAAFIARCLDSVLTQDYENLQVVVVDGESDDATADIVRRYRARDGRVELVANRHRTVPFALNLGLAAARGRWFVRVDAHATIPSHYVRRAIGHLQTGRWAAVGGRVDAIGQSPAGRAIALAMRSRFGQGNAAHHYAEAPVEVDHVPFPAYPTALARSLGGWNESLAVNQDFEFDYRLHRNGHRLLCDPELTIHYHCKQSIGAVFQQYHRYGMGKTRVLALHPESARHRHFAAPALVVTLAGAVLLARRRPAVALGLAAPYAAALAAATAAAVPRADGPATWLRVPAAFAAMHTGWGLGFWRGAARVAWSRLRRER